MAVKSITITEEAYNRLAFLKNPRESFSEVIKKITNKSSLLDLAGLLSLKEAEELKRTIREARKRMRKSMDNKNRALQ